MIIKRIFKKIFVVCTSFLFVYPCCAAFGQDVIFPTTEAQIVKSLEKNDVKQPVFKTRGLKVITADTTSKSHTVKKVAAMINFEFNSSKIRRDSYPLLDEFGKALAGKLLDAQIQLAGYTDNTGAASYNKKLSKRRAQAVKTFLISRHGISESRLETIGYGEASPIFSNDTESGRARNRRVEFIRLD